MTTSKASKGVNEVTTTNEHNRNQRGYINLDGVFGVMIVIGVVIGLLLVPAWKYLIKPALIYLLSLLTGGA